MEDWPRKCHFQPPVSRKPLLQNASCGVPDNLGVLVLPSLLTAVVKGHWQQFFFFPPLINFYLVKGKEISTDRSRLELCLHKEADTDSLVDFSLFSKSLTHLELCDCLVWWLTS